MKEIVWTEDLSVGIELIDAQHKMLIQRLNDLKQSLELQQGPEKIAATLGFLIDYTEFHFSAEEKHMEANGFKEVEDHKKIHETFKATLRNLEDEFNEEGATHLLADSMDSLLVNWLFKHIKGTDVAFGSFLESKGITIPEEA